MSTRLATLSALLFITRSLLIAHQSAPASAPQNETQRRMQKVESCLPPAVSVKGQPIECRTLASRMAALHIPAVSIAVVHHGVIEWAQGYGVQQTGGPNVTAETLFQAGSISKPVASLAALHLVQQGKLSLDADANTELTSWKIPPSAAAPGGIVTLSELLNHTAGFTVHGFPGYAANAPVPTLVEILNGQPPANTPPIRLESVPGSKWTYSGGGFTVMQQLVLDASKEPFPKLLHDAVLAPMGMTRSTYQQPLPADLLPAAAKPYNADGTPVQGGPHTYPEMAAAGLWSTPSDLARYIIEIQQSLQGRANHVLSQKLTEQMLTSGKGDWGLGVGIGGSPSNPYFSHGGVNEGYESLFVAYEKNGEGAFVMTNAAGGTRLCSEVMSSIAVAYDWPDFRPAIRSQIKLEPSALARFAGTYDLGRFSLIITLEGDQLMGAPAGQPKLPLYPESPTKFFAKDMDVELEFSFDDKGEVSDVVLLGQGHQMKGAKKKSP